MGNFCILGKNRTPGVSFRRPASNDWEERLGHEILSFQNLGLQQDMTVSPVFYDQFYIIQNHNFNLRSTFYRVSEDNGESKGGLNVYSSKISR